MIQFFQTFASLLLPKGFKATLGGTDFPDMFVIDLAEGLEGTAR